MDAVFHLLAYAMTMPGLEPSSLLQVMAFMQGPGLRLVAPFIASFFVGGVLLLVALRKQTLISKSGEYLYLTALGIAIAAAASGSIVSKRTIGLLVLAAISMAQASLGLELSWPSRDLVWNRDQFSGLNLSKQI